MQVPPREMQKIKTETTLFAAPLKNSHFYYNPFCLPPFHATPAPPNLPKDRANTHLVTLPLARAKPKREHIWATGSCMERKSRITCIHTHIYWAKKNSGVKLESVADFRYTWLIGLQGRLEECYIVCLNWGRGLWGALRREGLGGKGLFENRRIYWKIIWIPRTHFPTSPDPWPYFILAGSWRA